MTTLRPYVVFPRDRPTEEGAVLVFAASEREARRLAARSTLAKECCDNPYFDMQARRIRDHLSYLETLRTSTGPELIRDPPVCPSCELWGAPIWEDGHGCAYCSPR